MIILVWGVGNFQAAEVGVYLIEAASPMTDADKRTISEWADQLSKTPEAGKLAVRLHLLSLLFVVSLSYMLTDVFFNIAVH
jgi:hypothetical protein